MVTLSMLLIGLFVSGASASCHLTPALTITAPKTVKALSGSCLQIPCSFAAGDEYTFNSTIRSFGVWIKKYPQFENNNNIIFNGSEKVKMDKITLIGSLSEKNCTTRFDNLQERDSDEYYFRVENGPFKATASCDPVKLTIKDSPWSPRVKISGDLKENESVTITCSAVTSCPHLPPELTWNLQQDSHTQIKKKNGTFTAKIQKSVTLSDSHDGYKINCSVRYPVNEGKDFKTAETEETLRVSYAPKNTLASISPAGLVSAGTRVNLTCSSRASPPISSFSWFKKSLHGDVKVAEGDFYSLNETDGGVYYCVAVNDLGNQRSSDVHLNSEGAEQSLPWEGVVGGIIGLVILACVVLLIWRFKSAHSTSDQTQGVVLQGPVGMAENEEIHYGEIDFSTLRPPSDSVQESRQDQNAVYAQVKPHKTENGQTQAVDDIYAQVKKK